MKRIIKALSISFLYIILATTIVLATYSTSISVVNSSSTSYSVIACNVTTNVDYMANNNYFLGVEGLDTRITSGITEYPHMLVSDRIMFITPLQAYSSKSLFFTTGSSNLTNFKIIDGHNGNIGVADEGNLEGGGNFTWQSTLYIDTNNGTSKDIIHHQDSIRIYASETVTGNVTLAIPDTASPTGFTDPGVAWTNETNAYDKNTATTTTGTSLANTYTGFLQLSTPRLHIGSIQFYPGIDSSTDIDISEDGVGWTDIYEADSADNAWNTVTFAPQNIVEVRIRMKRITADTKSLYELRFIGAQRISLTGIPKGKYPFEAGANLTHYWLNINGTTISDTLSANTTNSAYPWTLFSGNSVPYADNITYSVNGTEQLYFAPNEIISGTTLPDRGSDGVNNNGTFSFGSNPSGVAVSIGMMESDYTPTTIIAQTGQDVMPPITPQESPTEAARKTALSGHFLYPFALAVETITSNHFTVVFQFQMGLVILAIVFFCLGYFPFRENLTIGGILSCIPIGYGVAILAFDKWVIIALILWLAGCVVGEQRRVIS